MKTVLIILLSLALAGAALATRPGKRELVLHLLDQRSPGASWSAADLAAAEELLRSAQVKDHYLWTDVEKDGKVLYTGAFAHWIPRGEHARAQVSAAADLAKVLHAVSSAQR